MINLKFKLLQKLINNKQHSNIDIATLKDKAVLRLNDLVDIDCNTNLMIGQRVKHEVSFSNIGTHKCPVNAQCK